MFIGLQQQTCGCTGTRPTLTAHATMHHPHLYSEPWLASRCSLTRMMLTPCCCLGSWFNASSTATVTVQQPHNTRKSWCMSQCDHIAYASGQCAVLPFEGAHREWAEHGWTYSAVTSWEVSWVSSEHYCKQLVGHASRRAPHPHL
jgi:hypothetical protein